MTFQVKNTLGVLSSEVATGNLVWVDQVSGNDALAVRGRLTIPFLTLGAAKRATVMGDTIIVMPGIYNETDLAKDGVSWHFLNGAKVIYTGASDQLFLVNSSMTFKVTGFGEFSHNGSTGIRKVLAVSNASSNVTFKCISMSAADTCIDIAAGATLLIECDSISSTSIGPAVSISAGTVTLTVRTISASVANGITISGGTVEIEASRITSLSSGKGVAFSGGTATIRAVEIYSEGSHGVEYNSTSAVLTLIGARLVTNWSTTGSRAVFLTNGATSGAAPLKLVSCTLLGKAGSSTASIDAAGPGRLVALYGQNIANLPENTTDITFQISTPLKNDSNVK